LDLREIKLTEEWMKLLNEALHNLYSTPNIIRQIKSRRMRWAGQETRMGKERKVYRVLMGFVMATKGKLLVTPSEK
jgi:hypothetical protein